MSMQPDSRDSSKMTQAGVPADKAIAETLRDLLLRFPCSVLEGVRWKVLCRVFRERFPEDSAALHSLSAAEVAKTYFQDFAQCVEDPKTGDGMFRLHDSWALAQGRDGQLACWPLLLQRLAEIVRSNGSSDLAQALESQYEMVGVLLARLKSLLREHWDTGFEERAIGYFNEEGCYVGVKKMKHFVAELLKWRSRRHILQQERGLLSEIDVALEAPIVLAVSQRHNDMILCCPISLSSPQRSLPMPKSDKSPCSLILQQTAELVHDGADSADLDGHASENPTARPRWSDQTEEQIGEHDGSGAKSVCSVSPLHFARESPPHLSHLNAMEKANCRMRIENAELKKKLRFDADLMNKEIRGLRVENAELKKRLYFSSQYTPHMQPVLMGASGMLTPMVSSLSDGQDGTACQGSWQTSVTPIMTQGFCYAGQLPQGMMSPCGHPWPPGTLIAMPFSPSGIISSGGNATPTPSSFSDADCAPAQTQVASELASTSYPSDTGSPNPWSEDESVGAMQLQALSSHRDDRWLCIPSGIVGRCTSQFECHEGLDLRDSQLNSIKPESATSSDTRAAQMVFETGDSIPSGIVEHCKSHFEFGGEDGAPDIMQEMSRSSGDASSRILIEGCCESATMFTIGDKVEVKPTVANPKYDWGDVHHRDRGIVKAIDPNGILDVDFPSHEGWVADPTDMQHCSVP